MNPFAIDATSSEKKLLFDKHRGDSGSSSSSAPVERVEYGSSAVLDKYDSSDKHTTWHLTISVLAAMIYMFLLGYNTSVMNSPEAVMFPGHSTFQWSLAVSSFAIGGPLGAVFGGDLADSRGRKGRSLDYHYHKASSLSYIFILAAGALRLNSFVFIFGGFIMTLAPNIYWLIPARFILGFASGLSSVVVPVYLGEISPPVYKGTIGR
jgi:SP family facilitated glucose transporter-like MFS transporter 3